MDTSTDASDLEGPSTSSKASKKQKYSQNYKAEWEQIPEFKGWLTKSHKGETFAKCRSCDKEINISSGKDALIKHRNSKFHLEKKKLLRGQQSIGKFVVDTSAKATLDQNIKKGKIYS